MSGRVTWTAFGFISLLLVLSACGGPSQVTQSGGCTTGWQCSPSDPVKTCTTNDGQTVPAGVSVYAIDTAYYCDETGNLETNTTLPCGLSTAHLAIIHSLWNKHFQELEESIATNSDPGSEIYNDSMDTESLVKMTRYCQDYTLADQLASFYNIALTRLSANQAGARIWASPDVDSDGASDELVLDTTLFANTVSYMLHTLVTLNQAWRTPAMNNFVEGYEPLFAETYARWIYRTPAMWLWENCFDPSQMGNIDPLHAYTFSDYVNKKKKRDLRLWGGAPVYCDAILGPELMVGSGVTELLAAADLDPNLQNEIQDSRQQFAQYSQDTTALFESRISPNEIDDARCTTTPCQGMDFDPNSYVGQPDYPASDWQNIPTAWDISHFRYILQFMDTVYAYPQYSQPTWTGNDVITHFANQLVFMVWNGDLQNPLFTNFISGANLQYRTFGPWQVSPNYFRSGYGFWAPYQPFIGQIDQTFVQTIDSGQPLYSFNADPPYTANSPQMNELILDMDTISLLASLSHQ